MNDLTLRKSKIIIRKALEKGKELGIKPLRLQWTYPVKAK